MKNQVKYYGTSTGKLIDYNNITEQDICIEDIAHHLAKIERYNGAMPIDITYSIAEHCINLCAYFESEGFGLCDPKGRSHISLAKPVRKAVIQWALLHDASEAYIKDLFPALKTLRYRRIEEHIEKLIFKKYISRSKKMYEFVTEIVSIIDKRIVMDEIKEIFPKHMHLYEKVNKRTPLKCDILYNGSPAHIKEKYLRTCRILNINDTPTNHIYGEE